MCKSFFEHTSKFTEGFGALHCLNFAHRCAALFLLTVVGREERIVTDGLFAIDQFSAFTKQTFYHITTEVMHLSICFFLRLSHELPVDAERPSDVIGKFAHFLARSFHSIFDTHDVAHLGRSDIVDRAVPNVNDEFTVLVLDEVRELSVQSLTLLKPTSRLFLDEPLHLGHHCDLLFEEALCGNAVHFVPECVFFFRYVLSTLVPLSKRFLERFESASMPTSQLSNLELLVCFCEQFLEMLFGRKPSFCEIFLILQSFE